MRSQPSSLFSADYLPVTFGILTTVGLASYNALAVTAALPGITADLGGVSMVSWVVTGFLLASTIGGVIAGPLVDSLGARATFRLTLGGFVAASVLCAGAPTMLTLVGLRVLQGLAGGMLIAVAHSAMGLAYPAELRSRAFAANSMVWGTSSVSSPAVAALFVSTVGWRGVFLVNLPLGLLAAWVAWHRLPGPLNGRTPIRLDGWGLLLLVALTAVVLVGLSELSGASLLALALAAVLSVAYWSRSGRVAEPILARRHFARLPFAAVNIGSAAVFGAVLGSGAYLPLYVSGALGYSPGVAAFSLLLLSFGWTLSSVTVSRLPSHLQGTAVALGGCALVVPALAAAAFLYSADAPLAVVLAVGFLQGCGVGAVTNTLITYLWSLARPDEIGRATAAYQYVRQLGYAYGAALFGAALLWLIGRRIGDVEPVRDVLAGDDVALGSRVAEAIADGTRLAYAVAACVAGLGFAAVMSLRRYVATRS